MKYFNNEGYADPTAYEALNRIHHEESKKNYRPMVYICSLYTDKSYVNHTIACCRWAKDNGCIPISPHLLFSEVVDRHTPQERKTVVLFSKAIMGRCAEVWVFGKTYTAGMIQEMKWARSKGKKIRFISEI